MELNIQNRVINASVATEAAGKTREASMNYRNRQVKPKSESCLTDISFAEKLFGIEIVWSKLVGASDVSRHLQPTRTHRN